MSTTRKPKKTDSATTIDFEKSLTALNQLIEQMETGQLSLADSLHCFEQGITLIRQCQHTLNDAEQKIQLLTGKTVKPFDATDHDD